jgi:arabinogalactan endo-1,4-beta-galactosidase
MDSYDSENTLCDIEQSVVNKCPCLLSDYIRKNNIKGVEEILSEFSKANIEFIDKHNDTIYNYIYSDMFGVDYTNFEQFCEIVKVDIEDIDTNIKSIIRLSDDAYNNYYRTLESFDEFEIEDHLGNIEILKMKMYEIKDELVKMENVKKYIDNIKDTYGWKIYLLFKKYNYHYLF